jgi:hypothetical protein
MSQIFHSADLLATNMKHRYALHGDRLLRWCDPRKAALVRSGGRPASHHLFVRRDSCEDREVSIRIGTQVLQKRRKGQHAQSNALDGKALGLPPVGLDHKLAHRRIYPHGYLLPDQGRFHVVGPFRDANVTAVPHFAHKAVTVVGVEPAVRINEGRYRW